MKFVVASEMMLLVVEVLGSVKFIDSNLPAYNKDAVETWVGFDDSIEFKFQGHDIFNVNLDSSRPESWVFRLLSLSIRQPAAITFFPLE
jgi:hypothetical protein